MSERHTYLLLLDVQSSLVKILEYTSGIGFEIYESDSKTKDAVERNFQIVGEAVSRIPDDFKKLHVHIEWRIIKDFRNYIIHEYFGIDNQIVWNIIQNRLPDLLAQISALLREQKADPE